MTGIELALAILPLVISATEHHSKLLKKAKTILSRTEKEEQLLDFYHDLHDEISLLTKSLNTLIDSLPSLTEDDKAALLNLDRKQWGDGLISISLSEALGGSETAFKVNLNRLLKNLEDLVSDKSIALSRTDTRSPDDMYIKLESFQYEMQNGKTVRELHDKFRFTKNEKRRKVALYKIHKSNKLLERLLQGSVTTSAEERRPMPSKRKTPPTRHRRLSGDLYQKMARKWPKSCDCHHAHEARLCLWNCCSSQRHPESSDSLDMLVSITDINSDGTSWQQSTILIPSEEEQQSPQTSVRFVFDGQSHSPPASPRARGRDLESESLCALIQQAHLKGISLQIVFEQGKLWQIKSRAKSLSIQKQTDTSLKSLLNGHRPAMKLKEKWILAVVLAHAVLHCCNSPWLSDNWSKEHISFFKDSDKGIDLARPYLTTKFEADSALTTDSDDESLFRPYSNPSLLALGVLLVEIYLNKPIESRWLDDDLIDGKPNEFTNLTTAMRIHRDMDGEVYEGYRRAILACLKSADDDSDNTEFFRREVYEKIVWPLEQELEHGFQITPEDLQLDSRDF